MVLLLLLVWHFPAVMARLYSSDGHFMSVYGAKSDKSEFALADPWIGYSNSGLAGNGWSYSKSATDIFKAYNSVNIGLMY